MGDWMGLSELAGEESLRLRGGGKIISNLAGGQGGKQKVG